MFDKERYIELVEIKTDRQTHILPIFRRDMAFFEMIREANSKKSPLLLSPFVDYNENVIDCDF